MRKLLALAILGFALSAAAQTTPTPNIGLQIPSYGSNNWNVPLNYNFTKLDQLLSGHGPALPALNVTNLTVGTITATTYLGPSGASFLTSNLLGAPNGVAGLNGAGVVAPAYLTRCAASGVGHSAGIVPDPGSTAGTTRYLREDCTWAAFSGVFSSVTADTGSFGTLQGKNVSGGYNSSQAPESTPGANDRIRGLLASSSLAGGGLVYADPSQPYTERIGYFNGIGNEHGGNYMPNATLLQDARGGQFSLFTKNPLRNLYTQDQWASTMLWCRQTAMPEFAPGSGNYPRTSCVDSYAEFPQPGFTSGNNGSSLNFGWALPAPYSFQSAMYGAGIHASVTLDGFNMGAGDTQVINSTWSVKGALVTASDEGVDFFGRITGGEAAVYIATVATGQTAGATNVVLTSPANTPGVFHPIIETGSGAGVITGTGTKGGETGAPGDMYVVTSSVPVPVSKAQGTWSDAVEVNPVMDGSATLVSVMVPAATSVSVGDFFNTFSRQWERAKVLTIGATVGGKKPLGMKLRFSHAVSEAWCIGGAAGWFYEMTGDSTVNNRYLETVACAPADSYTTGHAGYTETMWVGHQTANQPSDSFVHTGPFALYHGSYIWDVIDHSTDSTTGFPFDYVTGTHLMVSDNDMPLVAGDILINTNTIAAQYRMTFENQGQTNPYARWGRTVWNAGGAFSLYGGSLFMGTLGMDPSTLFDHGGNRYGISMGDYNGAGWAGMNMQYAPTYGFDNGNPQTPHLFAIGDFAPGSTLTGYNLFELGNYDAGTGAAIGYETGTTASGNRSIIFKNNLDFQVGEGSRSCYVSGTGGLAGVHCVGGDITTDQNVYATALHTDNAVINDDGSGSVAGGNFTWDASGDITTTQNVHANVLDTDNAQINEDGSASMAGGSLSWDASGSMTIGNVLTVQGGGSLGGGNSFDGNGYMTIVADDATIGLNVSGIAKVNRLQMPELTPSRILQVDEDAYVVSSLPLGGSGAAIPTGPSATTVGDVVTFSTTTGQQQDSGVLLSGLATTSALALKAPLASPTFTGIFTAPVYKTTTNCSSSASPAVCAAAAAGSVIIATGATSVTVNTTAVTANSQIFIQSDQSLGTKLGVTCNTTAAVALVAESLVSRVAGTSFTFQTAAAAITTNPACYSYFIIN